MSKIPYMNSSADPHKAQVRIEASLRKFGVSRVRFDHDIDNCELRIEFIFRKLPVCFPVNYKDLGKKFLELEPYTHRKRCSRSEWEQKIYDTAFRATYSMLDDLIKSMISVVDLGAYKFEEIFLGFFMGNDGTRVSDLLVPQLEHFSSQYLLPGSAEAPKQQAELEVLP